VISRSRDGIHRAFVTSIMFMAGRSLSDGAAPFIAPQVRVTALGTFVAPSVWATRVLIPWETGALLGRAALTLW
jgi:hypothetical protein